MESVKRISRAEICAELGCNVYERLGYIIEVLESGRPDRYEEARHELLSLLKFFPNRKRT
jgi:hypothetical protein